VIQEGDSFKINLEAKVDAIRVSALQFLSQRHETLRLLVDEEARRAVDEIDLEEEIRKQIGSEVRELLRRRLRREAARVLREVWRVVDEKVEAEEEGRV